MIDKKAREDIDLQSRLLENINIKVFVTEKDIESLQEDITDTADIFSNQDSRIKILEWEVKFLFNVLLQCKVSDLKYCPECKRETYMRSEGDEGKLIQQTDGGYVLTPSSDVLICEICGGKFTENTETKLVEVKE